MQFSIKATFFTVDLCTLTKLDGGLQSLHDTGDNKVYWLENVATTAFAK